jgi:hypothetical protein
MAVRWTRRLFDQRKRIGRFPLAFCPRCPRTPNHDSAPNLSYPPDGHMSPASAANRHSPKAEVTRRASRIEVLGLFCCFSGPWSALGVQFPASSFPSTVHPPKFDHPPRNRCLLLPTLGHLLAAWGWRKMSVITLTTCASTAVSVPHGADSCSCLQKLRD